MIVKNKNKNKKIKERERERERESKIRHLLHGSIQLITNL